jgi:hypothetical protein
MNRWSSHPVLLNGRALTGITVNRAQPLVRALQHPRANVAPFTRIQRAVNLITADGAPAFVVQFNTPLDSRELVRALSSYFVDHARLTSSLSFDVGLLADFSRGSLPHPAQPDLISWNSVSPRAGFAWQVPHSRGLTVRGAYSRLYVPLAGRYLDFGNPNSLGGSVYQWNALTAGAPFQPAEQGNSMCRACNPEVAPKRSLLLFQGSVIFADETADLLGHPHQFFPLLAIERNGEASEPVNGEPALLADFHGNLAPSGLLEGLILSTQSFNLGLQFFFRCHESVIAQQASGGRTWRAVCAPHGLRSGTVERLPERRSKWPQARGGARHGAGIK